MDGICDGCGKQSWLVPLHGTEGGPLRCFMCAGEWNAKHTRRRKAGRIVIKAMKLYEREGGKWKDAERLEWAALGIGLGTVGGHLDDIGSEVGDITSELLADVLQLTHPDRHPPERRELAERVTQQLLALKPFVFPAPKSEPEQESETPPSRNAVMSPRIGPSFPCELCADISEEFYCDRCKAEHQKREQAKHDQWEREREEYNAKQRKWYAKRKAQANGRPPTPPALKSPNPRRASMLIKSHGSNLINNRLSGLQASILIAAYTKRVPGANGADVSNPELYEAIWGWKPSHALRWTKEEEERHEGHYRAGDTIPSSYSWHGTLGVFNHIPTAKRRAASVSLSRALKQLEDRMLIDFVSGTMGTYSGGMVLTPHGEQIAKQLAEARSATSSSPLGSEEGLG
jgi:hypothetical protein